MREAIHQKLKSIFSGNKVWLHTLCFTGILSLFLFQPLMAQSGTQWNFHNEKLSAVLQKISEKNNINFSYDAGDPVFNRHISYSAKGESIDEMIGNILSLAGLQHKLIGKQTVIFHASQNITLPPQETALQPEEPEPEIIVTEDQALLAEYVLDTVFLHDTILHIDTLRITDTVFIEKEKPQKKTQPKIKELPVDFFQPEALRDEGWAMGVFVAPLLDDFSLVKGQKSLSLRSFSLGVDALKLLKRWNVSFGIRLTQFNHRFTQQYNNNEGGFFTTDTIDIYYTVTEFDTAWYYVTDSSWVPVEVREYNYQRTNTLGYLGFNISGSFDLYQNMKIRIYLKIGGQLNVLIYKNGLAITGDDQKKATDFTEMDFNRINFTISPAAGIKYKIADRTDFNAEFYYMRYMNNVTTDYPENSQINALGLKLGLVFYF